MMNSHLILRNAESMKIFADGDNSFHYGKWIAWRNACIKEGRMIPPSEFKSIPITSSILPANPD